MENHYRVLSNGNRIPSVFLGTAPFFEMGDYRFKRLRTVSAVGTAVDLGYGIDSAVAYGNHRQVGNGIRLSGRQRKEVFVTSKIFNNQQNHRIPLYYEECLNQLKLEYLDLLLLHWPQKCTFIEAWKYMEELYNIGKVKNIGMANVEAYHLEEMRNKCSLLPQVVQVELHPMYQQRELTEYCRKNKIQIQAYAPLGRMRPELINHESIKEIALHHGKMVPQVILRWHIQEGRIPVVRSARKNRIRENYDIWDFELTSEEISKIDFFPEGMKIYDVRKYVKYY